MGACFTMPNLIWRNLNKIAGVDFISLGKNISNLDYFDLEKREKTIDQIANHINIVLNLKNQYDSTYKNFQVLLPFGRKRGNYLFFVYMIVKIIYILNIFAQMTLMNLFFGFQTHAFGFDFLRRFFIGDDSNTRIEKAFPRFDAVC